MLPTTGPAPRRRNLPDFASQMLAGMHHADNKVTIYIGVPHISNDKVNCLLYNFLCTSYML